MQKPSREKIKKCVEVYEEYNKAIDALEDVIGLLSPSSYKPIIDFHNPLEVLNILYPEIGEEISYFLYECDKISLCVYEGKEYYLHNKYIKTLKEWLLALNLITE